LIKYLVCNKIGRDLEKVVDKIFRGKKEVFCQGNILLAGINLFQL